MKAIAHIFGKCLVNLVDRVRKKNIEDSLGHCGENVALRLPLVIEVPEKVKIFDEVSIASYVHMWGNGGITIGSRTMIASHVAITSASHDPSAEVMSKTLIESPVIIKNDVWIGAHAVIFPGITIGEHSVIGAGSVVNKDIPPYTIVAGVPATILKVKVKK